MVIYRDGKNKASMMVPYTTLEPLGSDNPRDLWDWLQSYEDKTGGQILAIAHNGNLSNGIMFPTRDSFTGKRLDRSYAETRMRWEPLYEVTQIKGDGETHPLLSPDDEFADYGTWDKGNLDISVAKEDDMLQYEYARVRVADRPAARAKARRKSLPVRHDRRDGQPYRTRYGRGRKLLRQALRHRTQPHPLQAPDGGDPEWPLRELGHGRFGTGRRLGHGKHARSDL